MWYPENVGARDCEHNGVWVLLIQNYFHKNQWGRQCKDIQPRIFFSFYQGDLWTLACRMWHPPISPHLGVCPPLVANFWQLWWLFILLTDSSYNIISTELKCSSLNLPILSENVLLLIPPCTLHPSLTQFLFCTYTFLFCCQFLASWHWIR